MSKSAEGIYVNSFWGVMCQYNPAARDSESNLSLVKLSNVGKQAHE